MYYNTVYESYLCWNITYVLWLFGIAGRYIRHCIILFSTYSKKKIFNYIGIGIPLIIGTIAITFVRIFTIKKDSINYKI